MGPEVAALALMAGGTAAQMLAADQQSKQQRAILNQAYGKSAEVQKDATAQVLDNGAGMAPGQQMQAMQAAENANYGRTQADIKGAGADIIDTAGGQGASSGEFLRAKADRALSEGDRLSAIARETAKVRAPGQFQTDQAMGRASLSEQLGSAARTNANGTRAAQMDAQDVQAPWYGDVGKIASLVGTMGMMAPAGAAGGAITSQGLAPALLGEAGTAGSTALGAVKFGDGAARMATLGGSAAGGASSALARALPMFGAAGPMFKPRMQQQWAGR